MKNGKPDESNLLCQESVGRVPHRLFLTIPAHEIPAHEIPAYAKEIQCRETSLFNLLTIFSKVCQEAAICSMSA